MTNYIPTDLELASVIFILVVLFLIFLLGISELIRIIKRLCTEI